jgi:hypothetical protein
MEGGCAFQEIGSRFLKNTSLILFRGCIKGDKMIDIIMESDGVRLWGQGESWAPLELTRVPPMVA